jgi:hypothetical protein
MNIPLSQTALPTFGARGGFFAPFLSFFRSLKTLFTLVSHAELTLREPLILAFGVAGDDIVLISF